MISDNTSLAFVRTIMKNINFLIILMLSSIVVVTTYRAVEGQEAWRLMAEMKEIPMAAWKVPVFAFLSFFALLYIMSKPKNLDKSSSFVLYGLIQTLLCFAIIYILNFNYNCILLLVIVDMIKYWKNKKERILLLVFLFLMYIMTDVVIIQNYAMPIPLRTYLSYYNLSTQNILNYIKNFLVSANVLLFMFYMVLVIQVQRVENERILELNAQLDEANDRLKEYAVNTEKMAQTKERNRFAREIHDTLGHSLTGIIAGLDACETLIDYSVEETRNQLKVISNVAKQGMKDVRRSVKALRPDALEKMNLEEAIMQTITEMEKMTHASIQFQNKADCLEFQEDEEETIYRIVQESVTNAIRHGKADQISVLLEKQYNILIITIRDNGIGCGQIEPGFGLRHMTERVLLLNGEIEYSGIDGFQITAKIPIRWGEQKNDKSVDCR